MSHKSLSFIIGASLTIAFSVLAFTEPTQAPPGGNVAAPINVSGTAQTKAGDLTVNNFFVKNLSVAPGVSEYNITNVNTIIGNNDLFLKGNSSETAPIYIAGSEIKIYTSSAERLTITSGGNVGIGTTVPDGKLHVSGGTFMAYPKPGIADFTSAVFSNNVNATIRFHHVGRLTRIHTDGGQSISLATNGENDRLTIDSSGNAAFTGNLTVSGKNICRQDGTNCPAGVSTLPWSSITSKPAGFADDVDNVGITSETDPTVLASVKDGVSWGELAGIPAGFADNIDNTGLGSETDPTVLASVKDGISWGEISSRPAGLDDGDQIGLQGGGTVNFLSKFTGSGTLGNSQILDDGSNVGIGTANPGIKLDVVGSNPGGDPNKQVGMYIRNTSTSGLTGLAIQKGGFWSGALYADGPNGSGGLVLKSQILGNTPLRLQTSDQDRIFIAGNGQVGIGTADPNAKFQVVGGDAAITTQGNGIILKATDGSNCFRVTVNNTGRLAIAPVTCP